MFTLLRYMFRIAPVSAASSLALAVGSAGLSVLLTFLVGQVVGAVPGVIANKPDALSMTAFSLLLAALLAAFLVESMLPTFDQMIGLNLDNHVHRALAIGITEPVLRPRRVAHLEDPQIKDIQEHAKGKAGFQIGRGVRNVRWLLSSRLTLFGSAALVGQMFSWPVAIGLVVVTLFMEYYRAVTCEREIDSWWGNTEEQRQADYAFNLGMRDAPKELRVFGLGGFLVDRYVAKWTEAFQPVWEARRRGMVAAIGVGVIHLGAQAGAILLVGRAALAGDLPLTQVATAVPAILAVGMSYNGFGVMMIRRALSAYRSMRDLPKMIAERYPEPVADAKRRCRQAAARGDSVRERELPLPRLGPRRAERARPRDPGGGGARTRRCQRCRQVDPGQAARRRLPADQRPDHDRRHRPRRARPCCVAAPGGGDRPGLPALPVAGDRQRRPWRGRTRQGSRRLGAGRAGGRASMK